MTQNKLKITEKDFDPKQHVKEIKCKCNQCGKIWHYLDKEEKDIKNQQKGNALLGCSMCCSPFGAYFSNKSLDLNREAQKLGKCPKCSSSDVNKITMYYEKQK